MNFSILSKFSFHPFKVSKWNHDLMGYLGRAGIVQINHKNLLPWGSLRFSDIRCHEVIPNQLLFRDDTFLDVIDWLKEAKQHSNPDILLYLIGNQADLEEE
jgi:hypothetical protein